MATAGQRIVVQATSQEKRTIVAKARRLAIPVSELMRRGAIAYRSSQGDAELAALADAAKGAAESAAAAIDDALDFIAASNRRITAMEDEAARPSSRKAA